MLGFYPISSAPISAFPTYYGASGIFGTGAIGTVTISISSTATVSGVFGTGAIGTVGSGGGQTVLLTGVRGIGLIDHVCVRAWTEVDTLGC
jgi:hypothetical protein